MILIGQNQSVAVIAFLCLNQLLALLYLIHCCHLLPVLQAQKKLKALDAQTGNII